MNSITPERQKRPSGCLRDLMDTAGDPTILFSENANEVFDHITALEVGQTGEGTVVECLVGGCALRCTVFTEGGVLGIADEAGTSLCD